MLQITRQKQEISIDDTNLPEIELNDIAETANGKLKIQFLDNAVHYQIQLHVINVKSFRILCLSINNKINRPTLNV